MVLYVTSAHLQAPAVANSFFLSVQLLNHDCINLSQSFSRSLLDHWFFPSIFQKFYYSSEESSDAGDRPPVGIWQVTSVPLGHPGATDTTAAAGRCCQVTITSSLSTFQSGCHQLRLMIVCSLLPIVEDMSMFSVSVSVRIMEFFSMAYEIMEYTPSTKCSNPFSESANSHIIIIKYRGKAIPVLLPFKFFIQIPPNYEH